MKTEYPHYVREYDLLQERRFGKNSVSSPFRLKKATLLLLLLLGLSCGGAFGQNSIEGTWRDDTEKGWVEITKKDGKYYGRLIAVEDAEKNERIREQGGIMVIMDFVQKDPQAFCCGNMYHPKYKLTVAGKLEMIDNQTLKVYGWYGFIRSSPDLETGIGNKVVETCIISARKKGRYFFKTSIDPDTHLSKRSYFAIPLSGSSCKKTPIFYSPNILSWI